MRRFALLLLASAAAVPIASCGSSETSDFAAEADRLCTEAAIEEEEIRSESGPLRTVRQIAALHRRLAPVRRELAAEIEALEPPDRLAAGPEDLGQAIRVRARWTRSVGAAGEARPAGFRLRVAALTAQRARARAAARALGMEECGEVVSADVRDELADVVEEMLVAPDPAQFCEALSERYMVELYGGPKRCARERAGVERPRGVELISAVGIPDVRIEVAVRQRGAAVRLRRLGLRLVFEDGRYRLDAVGLPGRADAPRP